MKVKKPAGPIGRPRAFDTGEALDRALQIFWQKGYEGASLSDLTAGMGINRPSLYAAFGDKQALFLKALDRYADGPAAFTRAALKEPTARAVVERLFSGELDALTDKRNPPGCLMVQGALSCGREANPIRQELISRRAAAEAEIRRRLKRAQSEGDLPAGLDPADLARYVTTVMHGMAVQAVGGATRRQLQRIVDLALRALPF